NAVVEIVAVRAFGPCRWTGVLTRVFSERNPTRRQVPCPDRRGSPQKVRPWRHPWVISVPRRLGEHPLPTAAGWYNMHARQSRPRRKVVRAFLSFAMGKLREELLRESSAQ